MKIHDGKCSGYPICTRTHGYKCRACSIWFRQDPYEVENSNRGYKPHPYYPYCSKACTEASALADKGYHLFAASLDQARQDSAAFTAYPDSTAHEEFNSHLVATKNML